MVADVLTKALGPDKFFRFMGVIFGLIRNDDLSAVQVIQAFRDAPPHKPIRDSPSLGHGAEMDGQPFLAAPKPICDSPSFGHAAEKDGQPFVSARKPIRDSTPFRGRAEKDGRPPGAVQRCVLDSPWAEKDVKPARDSSLGAEKGGQSFLTVRKPNRDSPLRARGAEKVGQRRDAGAGRKRLLSLSRCLGWRTSATHLCYVGVFCSLLL